MDPIIAQEIVDLQAQLEKDRYYMSMLSHFRNHEDQLIAFLADLPPEKQLLITDYVGLLSELHLYMLESAFSSQDKK